MKRTLSVIAALALVAAACTNLDEVNSRLSNLESDVAQLTSDIATLQNAVKNQASVTKLETITDGYKITFSDGTTATLKDGAKGDKGDKGDTGATGAKGDKGDTGATGAKGDKGDKGDTGDAFFKSVTVDGNVVIITLADETVIKVPVYTIDFSSVSFIPKYNHKTIFVDYYQPGDAAVVAQYAIYPSSAAAALAEGVEKGTYNVAFKPYKVRTRASEAEDLVALYAGNLTVEGATLTVTCADPLFSFENKEIALYISNTVSGQEICSDFAKVEYNCTALEYGGVAYHTALMQDGRWWMTENLRYIPAGKTPTTDITATGIDNGIWFPMDIKTKTLVDSTALIESNGYFYNAQTAFASAEPITSANAKNFEGCQGICPDGWHIPTAAEIYTLTGILAGYPGSPTAADITKYGATSCNGSAYYTGSTTKVGDCSIALLAADGFSIASCGAVVVANNSIKKGSAINTTSYILGSTMASATATSVMYYSIMPWVAKGTANGAKVASRSLVTVRCIKDAR